MAAVYDRLAMLRMTVALMLVGGCGNNRYYCTAIVSGTGTASDGAYSCQVPPNAVYLPSTQQGSIQGYAVSPAGHLFTFDVTMNGPPAAMTYMDPLSAGSAYTAQIFVSSM